MSNYTKSTNFTAKDTLPSGNSGKIIKGTEIDVELTAVASAISSKADSNSPTFTGTPLAPTAASGTNTTQLATTAFVQTALGGAFSTGMIVMWSGSIASIPSGWYLCDGTNSTPDLTDKFIIGAGGSYDPADEGGSADAIVVAHTHTATTTVTLNDPGHTHTITNARAGAPNGGGPNYAGADGGGQSVTVPSNTTGITVDSAATTVASSGSSATNANLPPYYALAFIMKG